MNTKLNQSMAQKYLIGKNIDALLVGEIIKSVSLKNDWGRVKIDIDFILNNRGLWTE